jgi:hypothetical protein
MRRSGCWCRCSSVVLWRPRSGWVVSELAEHPGAGDDSEAGQAAKDRCVRVLAEMVVDDRLELAICRLCAAITDVSDATMSTTAE